MERELELWARPQKDSRFELIHTYKIEGMSGMPGPKRREGDDQVPEGFYRIDQFNPLSKFHLSMRINYPNASDRVLSDKSQPGSDIYIHGGNLSIGGIAMGDAGIEELSLRMGCGVPASCRSPHRHHPSSCAGSSFAPCPASSIDLRNHRTFANN